MGWSEISQLTVGFISTTQTIYPMNDRLAMGCNPTAEDTRERALPTDLWGLLATPPKVNGAGAYRVDC